jgi:ABC-type uncharacterized transport system substrate-binding protein
MGDVGIARVLRVCAYAAKTFFLTLSLVTTALGHPHMWVDLESRVVLNTVDGSVAIQQVWVFDDFFSTSVIEDANRDPGGTKAGIQREIDRISAALEPYGYFTTIEMGGKNLSSKLVGNVKWEVVQNRIEMRFTVAANESVGSEVRSWSYAIFDPTYYIEMLHAEDASITIDGDLAGKCNSWVEQPNPSADAVALSQSTTLDNNANDTVGRFFAETVHVSC